VDPTGLETAGNICYSPPARAAHGWAYWVHPHNESYNLISGLTARNTGTKKVKLKFVVSHRGIDGHDTWTTPSHTLKAGKSGHWHDGDDWPDTAFVATTTQIRMSVAYGGSWHGGNDVDLVK